MTTKRNVWEKNGRVSNNRTDNPNRHLFTCPNARCSNGNGARKFTFTEYALLKPVGQCPDCGTYLQRAAF